MSRVLNRIQLEPGTACMHCDRPFDRPYERVPEIEGTSGNVVLRCPYCGLWTLLTEKK